jgi:hypothetical protein
MELLIMKRIIKKAQEGSAIPPVKKKTTAERLIEAKENRRKLDSVAAIKRAEIVRKKDSIIARQRPDNMTKEQYQAYQRKQAKQKDVPACDTADPNFKSTRCGTSKAAAKQSKSDWSKKKNGGKMMLKRKDGSVSQRGLWDNIRANKGSGKKPTAAMLKQERKINSKKK